MLSGVISAYSWGCLGSRVSQRLKWLALLRQRGDDMNRMIQSGLNVVIL